MTRLMEELAGRGVRKAYLEVEQTNAKAVGLYESLGFRNVGPLEDYYGEGRHGWHMVAELPASPNLFTANVA
jgi:ribosomal protein S18 acetylase RimI-like enzyme